MKILKSLLGQNAQTMSEVAFLAAYESGEQIKALDGIKTRGGGAVHDANGLRA